MSVAKTIASMCLSVSLIGLVSCDEKSDEGPPEDPEVCEFGKSGDPELCDGKDNDCDDETDEYANALCGGDCSADPRPDCSASTYPAQDESWPTPNRTNSNGGVYLASDGSVTVGNDVPVETGDVAAVQPRVAYLQDQETFLHVWIANTVEGTVSKIDAETGKELARYPSVIQNGIQTAVGEMDHNGQPSNEPCGQPAYSNDSTPGNCPSRIAVDQLGHAYVANRAFSGQGTVTKFADYGNDAEKKEFCDDRNEDGVIQTSADRNGDGTIDIGDPQEYVGYSDECILWTRNVGGNHGVPRALSVGINRNGGPGLVWVGMHGGDSGTLGTRQIVALDPDTGLIAERANNSDIIFAVGDFQPNSAVTTRDGRVWFANRFNSTEPLGYVTADTSEFVVVQADVEGGPYGLTADAEGRLYLGSYSGSATAYRYDPDEETMDPVLGEDFGRSRGVAVDRDHLWVAVSHNPSNQVTQSVVQYRLSDLSLVEHHSVGCSTPIGIGMTANARVFAACYGQPNQTGFAAFFDGDNWKSQEIGINPFTYSDFTGFNLNFLAEDAAYSFVVAGCEDANTRWEGLSPSSGLISEGSSLSVRVRAAASQEELISSGYSEPIEITELKQAVIFEPKPEGAVLQVQLLMSVTDLDKPLKINALQVAKTCLPSS
jgi:streptogramin lyase